MDELAAILKDEKIAAEWKADSIRQAIENGADPNGANGYALRMAAVQGLADVARILCGAGADPNVNGGAAMKMAVRYDHPEIIEILRDAGGDIGPALDYANARVSDNNAPEPENAAAVARDIAKTKKVIASLADKDQGPATRPRDDNGNNKADILNKAAEKIDGLLKDNRAERGGAAAALGKASAKIGDKIKSRDQLRRQVFGKENE